MRQSPHAGTLKRDHPICFRAMGSPEDTSDGQCRMITGKSTHKLLGRSHPWKPDGFRPIDLWHDGTSDAAYPEVGAGALAYRNGTLRARKSMLICRSSSNGRARAFQAWNAGSNPVCGSTVIETDSLRNIYRAARKSMTGSLLPQLRCNSGWADMPMKKNALAYLLSVGSNPTIGATSQT